MEANLAIVGAGPAGLSAARAYRNAGGTGRVLLLGDEPHLPYRRPPLSKEFLRGQLDESELRLQAPSWYAEKAIELRLDTSVTAIDPTRGELSLTGGETLAVDACVLASGSEPVRPSIPGAEGPSVMVLRRLPDSRAIRNRVGPGARVTVIGSGFIGCEAAASLASRGAQVTLLSQEPAPLAARLGEPAGARIRGWLEGAGIHFRGSAEVTKIEIAHALVKGQPAIEADLIVLGAGAQPRSELARACGVRLVDGRVETDASLRSSDPFLFAAGDVAFAENRGAGRRIQIKHWGDALAQGETAGRVLADEDVHWDDVPGFWSTIGSRTIKYAAWRDGFDTMQFEAHEDGAFTVWYESEGVLSGVLTHERDADYEHGRELIALAARAR